jgi:Tol biopolymer transport system component
MNTPVRLFRQCVRSESKTVEPGRNRAFTKFGVILGVLSLVLLVASITSPPASQAAFPGTNGKIVFQSTRDGNSEIYVMNADGSGQTRLTNNSAWDATPTWSSDGTKIAFVSDRDGNAEIYVMNADGSGQTRLTNNSVGDVDPAWSPDGTKIAFGRDQAFGIRQIWVMNANGSGETQLTNDSLLHSAPVWSPDGTKIAFLKAVLGGDAEVFVMNVDGSGQINLSNNQAHPDQDLDPDWSPDGTKLAFFRGGGGLSEIWVMNADGSGQTKLSTSSTVGDGAPVWSPDGAKIAFTTLRDGNAQIYVMNANGSGATNLSNNSAGDAFPDWQPVSDITPPVVNVSFPSPNGQNGWFITSPVVGSVTADDTATGGSNITDIICTGATVGSVTGLGTPGASAQLTVSAEGVNNVSCTAIDSAGNSGAAAGSSNTATVQIDTVAPAILITLPANGGTYTLNTAVASNYSCSDATSGVAACVGPVANGANFSTSPVSAHAFTVNATDVAGNQAQATNNYNIIYNFSGFSPPVDNLPTLNVVKAGSAVPVKFSLSGNQGLSIFEAGYPKSQTIPCDSTAPVDGIEETATAGSSGLSYDASVDQYVYVWKTEKAWAGTCRQLVVKLNDGTSHQANFNFTK